MLIKQPYASIDAEAGVTTPILKRKKHHENGLNHA
jgi:hypothetical protein